jgi:hypothetical protein
MPRPPAGWALTEPGGMRHSAKPFQIRFPDTPSVPKWVCDSAELGGLRHFTDWGLMDVLTVDATRLRYPLSSPAFAA